jgi:Na+-transporting methylmalonyl-CoA/oxaloacetate decarboxylase gamma subunit
MTQLNSALFLTAVSLAAIFIVFFLLIGVIRVLTRLFPYRPPVAKPKPLVVFPKPTQPFAEHSEAELVAVLNSVLACHLKIPPTDIRILSIKPY